MHADPSGVDSEALPRRFQSDGQVVPFEEPVRHELAAARAVPAQIGEQDVVAGLEGAHGRGLPFRRVAPFPVKEQDRGPLPRPAGRGENSGELDGILCASGVGELGDDRCAPAQRREEARASLRRGREALG